MDWRVQPPVQVRWRGNRVVPFRTKMKRILYCRIKTVLDRYEIRPRPLQVEAYLCASIDTVLDHIQSQFSESNGFSWNNFGAVWQLDHINPVGRNNDSIDDVIAKLHYENLQPLDRKKNAAKAANGDGGTERVMFRRNWFP